MDRALCTRDSAIFFEPKIPRLLPHVFINILKIRKTYGIQQALLKTQAAYSKKRMETPRIRNLGAQPFLNMQEDTSAVFLNAVLNRCGLHALSSVSILMGVL